MAVYTSISLTQAERIANAYGIININKIEPIPAGSVNSNYRLHGVGGAQYFLRVYEEQGSEGLRFEFALMRKLQEVGLAVPKAYDLTHRAIPLVNDKPAAIFEWVGGHEICQRMVTPEHLREIGGWMAMMHVACESFSARKTSRFRIVDILQRASTIDTNGEPELERCIEEVTATLRTLKLASVPQSVIHGDLFRDNVRWNDRNIAAVLDWDSASNGPMIYDVVVTMLSWCYADRFDWTLAKALWQAYVGKRSLSVQEVGEIHSYALFAAARFTITRITDFHLRKAIGDRVMKDYRRFYQRFVELQTISPGEFNQHIGLS